MKNIRFTLLGSTCAMALALTGPASAVQQNVVEVDAVDQVSGLNLSTYTAFHAASYHCASAPCPADGGEGLFLKQSGGCTVDGGRVVKDSSNACFYRQNLNGDLRQFGAYVGSPYDCSPTTGSGVSGCSDASSLITKLKAAVAAAGLHSITTAGVQIKTSADFEVPSGVNLNLGGIAPMGHRVTNTGLLDIPGTIFLATGKSVKLDDHSGIRNGIILPDWYTVPTNIHDLYALRDGMVSHDSTGLLCAGSGCVIDDMEVDGFDTAVEVDHGTDVNAHNVLADGNVCYYLHGGGAGDKFESTGCFPGFSYATTPGNQPYVQEYFGVTTIAESPATTGICRVTLAKRTGTGAPDVDDIENNFMVWGTGANKGIGGANMNNRFKATLISATSTSGTFDLQNSKCHDDGGGYLNGPTVTATWKQGDKKLVITGMGQTTDQILANEVIRGMSGSGIPNNTGVGGIWAAKNTIILDTPATADGSGSVTFKGQAFSGRTVDCDGLGGGVCLVLDGIARVDAGGSPGGAEAGGDGHATGYMIGGDDTQNDEVSSFISTMSHTYGHAIQYHVMNSNETRMYGPFGDGNGNYEDPNTIFAWIDGHTSNGSFVGGVGQKAGTGILVNMSDSKACFSYVAAGAQTITHDMTQFEVDGGCFLATGMRPGSGNGFVANAVEHVDLTGSYLPGVDMYYEGPEAQGKTSTLGAQVTTGANNLINLSFDTATDDTPNAAPLPPSDTSLQIVQADGVNSRVVQDVFGATTVVTGRRADGTTASPSHVLQGEQLAEYGGMGWESSNGYPSANTGGVGVEACDGWTATDHCTATTFKATEKGQTAVAEVARAESAGIGVNSGTGVAAQLEVVSTNATTTLTSALTNSFTGTVTVGSTTGFPSPGTMLIDGEAISYKVASSTSINIVTRGVWGTAAAAHSAGATISYFSEFKGNPTTPRLDFATDSLGDMWWRGHLLSGGSAPTLSGGLGSGPTIVGNDNAGRITAGTGSIVATTFTVTFAQPWLNAPVCFAQDETNTAKNPIIATTVSTTAVTFTAAASLGASNKVSYACVGFR